MKHGHFPTSAARPELQSTRPEAGSTVRTVPPTPDTLIPASTLQGMMSTHLDNTNFIQLCISNALQEVGESENNRTNTLLMEDNSSKESNDYEHNSLLYYYLENDVTKYRNSSTENYQDISNIATHSLASDTDSDIDTINMRDDKTSLNLEGKDDQDTSV